MGKSKKFRVIRVPIGIEYSNPVLGRLYGLLCWLKCIKLFKLKIYGRNYYCLAIPKYEVE